MKKLARIWISIILLIMFIIVGNWVVLGISCWECPMLYGKTDGPTCRICCDQNCPPDRRQSCKLGCYEQ